MAENQKLFALLIDGDNISAAVIAQIWNKLKEYGELRISKVFHTKTTIDQWEQIAREYGIEPIWVPNNTTHKNSVDIALVMEAMILLYERAEITDFCIIATDSDYTRLARHLKSEGKFVLGIGEEQTPMPFRTACTQFIDVNKLVDPPTAVTAAGVVSEVAPPLEEISESAFLKLLIEAYEQLTESEAPDLESGWVPLLKLKAQMVELNPVFRLNSRLLAEKLEAWATTFPTWFKIQVTDSKPVLHQVCLPEDGGIYKFLAAYVEVIKIRKLGDKHNWVQVSALSQALQGLFPQAYPVKYKDALRPQKVIEKMSEDQPGLIKLNTTEKSLRVRFKL